MDSDHPRVAELETQLNDTDPAFRAQALTELAAMAKQGAVSLEPEAEVANMHCHTFFSFNGYGFSPTSLAWLAKRRGYRLMGIVDFDVLDGAEEFLAACERVGVRGSVGMETRVFVPEFASHEINSPGEPGVFYHMGIGFTSSDVPDNAAGILKAMRERSAQRNQDMAARINAYLDPVTIDYEHDVLPLTPSGNATERHMLMAYMHAAEQVVPNVAEFWASKLDLPVDQVVMTMAAGRKLQEVIRSRLMKRGGVGYVQPDHESFPSVEEFHQLILACGALPCATWLDGTSAGEQAISELLELLIGKGAVALNIIPDRNWNIADPEMRRRKIRNLYEVVELAKRLALPLNVGTEMNKYGQRLVDDFDAPDLAPVREAFLDGAYFIYGHTILQRALGMGYQSEWARAHMSARQERNAFYTQVGRRAAPGQSDMSALRALDPALPPDEILSRLTPA